MWPRRWDRPLEAEGRAIVPDYQAGIFAVTNDVIETMGGRPPMSLGAFIEKHRKGFE